MEIKSKKIELVNPKELCYHSKNMNKHSKEQIDRLIKLIEYQGFRVPVIVQMGTNLVVAGNGRLEAALKMKLKEIPVIYQEFDSEAQLYSFMTSDNAIASWAELDLEKINTEILSFDDFDMELLGLKNFSILKTEMDEDKEKEEAEKKHILQIELPNDCELRDLYDDLVSKGYLVKEL